MTEDRSTRVRRAGAHPASPARTARASRPRRARSLQRVPGAELLSAESQQAFYEAQLARRREQLQAGRRHRQPRCASCSASRALRTRCSRRFGSRRCGSAAIGCCPRARRARSCCCRPCCARRRCWCSTSRSTGSTSPRCAELAHAIVHVAAARARGGGGHVRRAASCPFALDALREVVVLEQRRVVFRGTPAGVARARSSTPSTRGRPPPVELGSWYEPLDPGVPLVQLVQRPRAVRRAGRVRGARLHACCPASTR